MRTFLSIRQMAEIVSEATSRTSWEWDRDTVVLYVKFIDDSDEKPWEVEIYADSFVGKSGEAPHLYHHDEADVRDTTIQVLRDNGSLYGCTAMWFEVEPFDSEPT